MKEITIVEPVFVADFKCVGSECRDHCCKGWDISLDKTTVNRYLKSHQIEIRNIASTHINTTKKSFTEWGKMALSSGATCGFMDSDNLCKVHKNLGASALSNTCATYPRAQQMYKSEVHKSVTLSCPEATKQLLTRPDAMLFNQNIQLQPAANKVSEINQEQKLVNLMCANIIKVSGVNSAEGLYGIAILLLQLENMKKEGAFNSELLENNYFSIIDSVQNGSIARNIADVKTDNELQWSLLMRLHSCFGSRNSPRSFDMLKHYLIKLVHIQAEGAKKDNVGSSMVRLDKVWQEKVNPWLEERPHLMSNYLQYRIYNDMFPGYQGRSPLACLYLLTAEWFFIKSIIAACVELVGEVIEDDIINIIYSFHALTKHDATTTAAFFAEIDKVKVNDDLSLIYLLK